ncbi:universal stress protein [Pseudooceanicola aestuarii]|uniref:universal stress protein n=1 Tax=Pseudooceanicola aestuarii TaxID=2697319 RepID=UPI0013D834EC|nr:universal stress protein [Pseudooceanicola aestuarii]
MFNTVMVPVDLAHADKLDRALSCAADLAQLYKARVVYVGVSAAVPGAVARTPEEFAAKLDAFANEQARLRGIEATAHAVTSHDPATDLDPALLDAVKDTGADLVVMASHIPNVTDYIWPSNGGSLATHAKVSVLIVRGG